jgi:cell division protein ZipA
MEITTIIGIAIAVIIMAFGLRLLLKKPNDAAPSLDSELQINEDCQKPIIPRHVRDQLQVEAVEETRQEPTLNDSIVNPESEFDKAEPKLLEVVEQEPSTDNTVAEKESAEIQSEAESTTEKVIVENTTEEVKAVSETEADDAKEKAQLFSLNSNIEKAEISEFEDESSILDAHLYEQKMVDDECALVTAESFIAFNVLYKGRVLSGEKTLKVLLKYGLRFGEMKCFHRYNEDSSKLLFSALQITDNGTDGFDLETLSTEEVKGLALFLALPHSDVQNAFDTMVSIANLIAREIQGTVYDQNNHELTPQLREYWRHQAIDYRAGQSGKA